MPDLPEPSSTDAASERHQLFGAVVGLLREIARHQLCVVVLDDLHWADRATVQLLRHVLSTVDLGAVLVVGTYRDTDLGADHPLTEALASFHREPGVEVLHLQGLADVEVVALLESIAGHELGDDGVALAHAVRTETGGNPFFVGEVLRHLAETGAIVRRNGRWVAGVDLSEIGLPASVRAVVGDRVRRLGEEAHQVLVTAAVVGRDFDVDIVAAAGRFDEDEVLDALDAAAAAGLVAETAVPDRYTFTHALVQHTLYEELTGARRVRLHQRIAEELEARLGDDPADRIGELATHWLAATRPAEPDKAVDYARRAGDRAMASLAFAEAARWYERALDAGAHARQRCELLVALSEAREADRSETGLDAACDAGELAHDIGADDLLIEAARSLWFTRMGEVDERILQVVEWALEAAGTEPSPARASLLALLGRHIQWADPNRSYEALDEAATMVRAVGDDRALMEVAANAGFSATPDRLADRLELTTRALELAAAGGHHLHAGKVARSHVNLAFPLGDLDAVTVGIEALRDAAERTGDAGLLWWSCAQRGRLALLKGDPVVAEELANQSLEHGAEGTFLSLYGVQLILIRFHQGRLAELVDAIAQAAADNPRVLNLKAAHAWALADAGRLDEARDRLAHIRANHTVPWDREWLSAVWLLGETAAAVGDTAAAADLYDQLRPWSKLFSTSPVTTDGLIAHTLGLLADLLGQREEAISHLETSIEISRRIGAPFHLARAQAALGRIRADRALLEDAQAIASARGYAEVEADATAALETLT